MDNSHHGIKKYRFYGEDYDLVKRWLDMNQIPFEPLNNNTLAIESKYEDTIKEISIGRFTIP